jgi:ZIP family zinc transporter
MRKAGRSGGYVFGIWGAIAAVSGLSAGAGYVLLDGAPPGPLAAITALAAGAILAMLADTMIPEAFDDSNDAAGLITAFGFLVAFCIERAGG